MPAGYIPPGTTNPSPTTRSGGGSWIPPAVGGLFSSWINARQQKKERKHRTQTEEARRAYDLEQWHRANKYNHPAEQMQRLRDAGLNPNMIYGSSPGSAVGNAGQIPTAQAPDIDYTNWAEPGIQQYQNIKVNQAQTNNLRSLSNLNTSNSIKAISDSRLAESRKEQILKLLPGNYELQQEQVKQATVGTFLKILEKTGKQKYYLSKVAAEAAKAVAEGEIAEARVPLAKLDEELAKIKIRPGDPLYMSIMARVYGAVGEKMKEIKQGAQNIMNYWD